MKLTINKHLLVAVAFTLITGAANAATVAWKKTPINVDLVVGVEQMVILPQDGAVGLPPALSNTNVFRTLVTGGTAYWTALEAFDAKRIKVRLDSGEFLLFDVTARVEKSPPATTDPIQVVVEGSGTLSESAKSRATRNGQSPATLFELIRYAAQ